MVIHVVSLLAMLCIPTISLGDLPIKYNYMERSSGQLQAMCLCISVFRRWACVCTWTGMSTCEHTCVCVHGKALYVHGQMCVCMDKCVFIWAGMCVCSLHGGYHPAVLSGQEHTTETTLA